MTEGALPATADIDPADRRRWQVPEFAAPLWLGRTCRHCVVVPVINEGDRIRRLLTRMEGIGIARIADIVIVDGGSTDGSLEPGDLQSLGVRGLLVKKGAGRLGAQLRCAYAHALEQGYDGVVTIDGNDKDDPEAIPRFIARLEAGFDFVQASRFIAGGIAENTPRVREWAIRCIHAPMISWRAGFRWTDTTQGYRAYSRRLLLDPRIGVFRDLFSRYELLAYLSCRAPRLGYRCIEIPTARRYPKSGPVPTKIGGIRGNLELIVTLVKACFGRFDPPGRI